MEVIPPGNNLLNIASYQHILSCSYYCCCCCCCCLILCSTITLQRFFTIYNNHAHITYSPYSYNTLPFSCYPYNTSFMFQHWARWLVESERVHQNNSFSNSTVYVTFHFLITYSQAPKEPNLGFTFHH